MKTLTLLLIGLGVGAAGYWWLYGPPMVSTGSQINDSVVQATASPDGALTAAPVAIAPSPTHLPTPAEPEAEATHVDPTPLEIPMPASKVTTPLPLLLAAGDGLLLPVQGLTRADLHDTFTDARSEGRVHDAIDIMAPAGTPVLAVADGTVEKLFDSKRGGLTIYQFEPSGRYAYYYAHLQRYADGIAEKQPIHRGQVIGYVGSTGNASAEAPHLHFAIFKLGPERHWWEGEAINPYPALHDGQAL